MSRTPTPSANGEPRPGRKGIERALLAFVLLAALALRLYGLTWGLPDQRRLLSYHPDEGPNLVGGVLDAAGAPRPHLRLSLYNYGGLYFYLWQGAAAVNQSYGAVRLPGAGDPDNPSTTSAAALILVGRLLTVLCGVLAAWATFALGRRLYGPAVGLAGAALWAAAPAAVVHGHYATVDSAATLFTVLALVFSARSLTARPATAARELAAAAALSGLAAATRYNCVVVALAPAAAAAWAIRDGRVRWWAAAAAMLAVPAAFALGNPGCLLDTARFWRDVAFEATKSRQGAGLLFAETGIGWVYHATVSLRFGLTVPALLLAAAGTAFALVRRERGDVLLLLATLAMYALIGAAQVRFLRYVIPLLPMLGLLGARAALWPWQQAGLRAALRGAGIAAGLAALAVSAAMNSLFGVRDARDRALDELEETAPPRATVALATTPWYYTPPFGPGLTLLAPGQRREAAAEVERFTLRLPAEGTEWDVAVLGPPPPDLAVVTDVESADPLRVGHPPAVAFMERVEHEYRRTDFVNAAALAGFRLPRPRWLPNDWLYTWPRVSVYRREGSP